MIAGARQGKKVDISALFKEQIDIPCFEHQKKIVDNIEIIKKAIEKNIKLLELFDELVNSCFFDMFKRYMNDTVTADTFFYNIRNGVSPSTSGKHYEKSLTLSAFTQGDFDKSAWKDGYFDNCPPADKRITDSDFYICRGNGNKELVGTGAYSTKSFSDLVFPDTIIAAKVDLKIIDLAYLCVAWKQPNVRIQIEKNARTTNGTFKINQQMVASIQIALPPLDLQKNLQLFFLRLQ